MLRLEQEEAQVEGAIRQTIGRACQMLSDEITNIAPADVNTYIKTLSRLLGALVAVHSTE
jgi:superfamily II RNA helicase